MSNVDEVAVSVVLALTVIAVAHDVVTNFHLTYGYSMIYSLSYQDQCIDA